MSRTTRRLLIALVALALVVPVAALASDRFTDVPDSNVFHDDITWLADAAVTLGCNPPANDEFCPDDFVTREQMAAFMKRLAENQVVDAATAIEAENADTVDGFHATDLASLAAFAFSDDLPDTDTTLDATIEAPAGGTLVMNGTVSLSFGGPDPDDIDDVDCQLLVDGSPVEGTSMTATVASAGLEPLLNHCSTTGAFVVDPGSHTVTFEVSSVDEADLDDGSVNAIWVPFDGTGAVPTPAAGQAGTGDDESPGR